MVAEATLQLQALAREKSVVFRGGTGAGLADKTVALLPSKEDALSLTKLLLKHGMDADTVPLASGGGFAVAVEAKLATALKNLGLEVRESAISPESVRRKPGENDRGAER